MTRQMNLEFYKELEPFLEIPLDSFHSEYKVPCEGSFVIPDLITKDLRLVVELKTFNKKRGDSINGIGYWINQHDRYFRSDADIRHVVTAIIAPSFEEFHTKQRYVPFYNELIKNSTRFGRSHEVVFATNQRFFPNSGYDAFNDSMEIIALFQALMGKREYIPRFSQIGNESFVSLSFGRN